MLQISHLLFSFAESFPGGLANKALAVVETLEGKVSIWFLIETILVKVYWCYG